MFSEGYILCQRTQVMGYGVSETVLISLTSNGELNSLLWFQYSTAINFATMVLRTMIVDDGDGDTKKNVPMSLTIRVYQTIGLYSRRT